MPSEPTERGPGRPPISDHDKRKHRKICVTDSTWERWRAAAQRAGVSISQWIEAELDRQR